MQTRWPVVLGMALTCTAMPGPARAETPVPVFVRNLGRGVSRVQLAIGSTLPCDARDNALVFDERLRPGEVRALVVPLGTVVLCARNTSAGSTIDWGPSEWRRGGVRCSGARGRWCVADPTVPFQVDVRN